MRINSPYLLLDACCIFNFLASGNFLAIVKAIPAQVLITQIVWEQELIHFERFEEKDKYQFNESISREIVKIIDFESEEETDLFVNYAAMLGDDGESATGAIAIYRSWSMATDDKAAIKLFLQENSDFEILSTPEIIKYWSEKEQLTALQLKIVLKSIQEKGRYRPFRNHPLEDWWKSSI